MKYLKMIIAAAILLPIIGWGINYAMNTITIPFESICVPNHEKYTDLCKNVGKRAHSIKNVLAINDTDYGPIVGVAWRKTGGIISSSGQAIRRADTDGYYYIIGADDYYFLRNTSETEAK